MFDRLLRAMGVRPSRSKQKQRQMAGADSVVTVSKSCGQYEDPRLHVGYIDRWCRPSPSPRLSRRDTRVTTVAAIRMDGIKWVFLRHSVIE